jgi:hypothetical protein
MAPRGTTGFANERLQSRDWQRAAFVAGAANTSSAGLCGFGLDVAVIPGWVEQEAFFHENTEVIDLFAPVREDFLAGEIPACRAQR